MKIILLFVIIGALTDADLLYNSPLPYALSYNNPYALSYSNYFKSPYILPYAYGFELKPHHPEEKAIGEVKEPIISNAKIILPMPQKTSDLQHYTFNYPITYTIPTPLSWPTATQFHQQDELGQYHYGYSNHHSSKQEIKTFDGVTRGSYSYVDSNGELQTVNYISDGLGFRVAATNLPKSPKPIQIPDSPEVALAKEEHFRAQNEALKKLEEANANDSKPM